MVIELIYILLGNKCAKCGDDRRQIPGTNRANLELDHIEPQWQYRHKKETFSSIRFPYIMFKDAIEEMQKLQLLCHACHAQKTRADMSLMRYVMDSLGDEAVEATWYCRREGTVGKYCKTCSFQKWSQE